MKILLLNPPTPDDKAYIREGRCNQEQGVWSTLWPPLTLATAGAMLEVRGHKVEILDCAALGMSRAELLDRIQKGNFRLVILSAGTPSITSDLALTREIKAVSDAEPGIMTGVLGAHVTALAQQSLEEVPSLDLILRNEPEAPLAELADALESGTGWENIPGISFRGADGRIVHNPSAPLIRDLDSLPFPAWHLLDLERYKLPLVGEKFLMLGPIRGCPYLCNFCTARTYYGKSLRKRSAPKMADEITYLMNRFKIRNFFIWADTFTADPEYVKQFCREIRERSLDISWTCNSRVDTVDQETMDTMAQAGCWMVSFGIESGSQEILDRIRKRITLSQSRSAVHIAKKSGIKVAGHFVMGFPGETEETLRQTIQFALSLELDIAQFYCAVPFPGSPLYKLALNKGWIDGKTYKEFRQDNAVMELPGLPSSVVNAYRKKGYMRFYLRPARVLHLLKLINANRIGKALKGGLGFMKWVGR